METKLATKRRLPANSAFLFFAFLTASIALCPIARAQNTVLPLLPFDDHAAQTGPANQSGQGPRYTGPGSCASTTCHGSVSPRTDNRVLQNEYSTWIVKDKHSKAYASLQGNVGERMAAILGIGKAESAPKCLACHALDVPTTQ